MFLDFNNNSLKSISKDRDHSGLTGELTIEDRPYIFALRKAMEHFFLDPLITWKCNFGLGDMQLERRKGGEQDKGFQTIIAVKTLY